MLRRKLNLLLHILIKYKFNIHIHIFIKLEMIRVSPLGSMNRQQALFLNFKPTFEETFLFYKLVKQEFLSDVSEPCIFHQDIFKFFSE